MNKEIFFDHHKTIFVGEKISGSDQKWALSTEDIKKAEELYREKESIL